jgi:hypothetical protein
MNFIEFVGFIISFLFFLVLIMRRTYERWKKTKFPEEGETAEEETSDHKQQLKDFLKSLDVDMEEIEEEKKRPMPPQVPPPAPFKEKPPAPKPLKPVGALVTAVDKQNFETHMDKRHLETKEEDRFAGAKIVSSYFREPAAADPYHIKKQAGRSAVRKPLYRVKNRQDMVILHEIIGRPKALR